MRKKSGDSLHSVDSALRLIHLLRDQGEISVTEAAAALGVSSSSAHRLLTTLAYRDFAEQDHRRRYVAGPALRLRADSERPVAALREMMLPRMRSVSSQLSETVSLGVLIGDRVRITATVEAVRVLRVGDQEGTVLPASRAAVGKAILATLPELELEEIYGLGAPRGSHLSREEWQHLARELETVRNVGFAINHGEAEPGVSAIAVAVLDSRKKAQAGLAVVMPSSRFAAENIRDQLAILTSEHHPPQLNSW